MQRISWKYNDYQKDKDKVRDRRTSCCSFVKSLTSVTIGLVRFQVLTKTAVLSTAAPCGPLHTNGGLRGAGRLHHNGDLSSWTSVSNCQLTGPSIPKRSHFELQPYWTTWFMIQTLQSLCCCHYVSMSVFVPVTPQRQDKCTMLNQGKRIWQSAKRNGIQVHVFSLVGKRSKITKTHNYSTYITRYCYFRTWYYESMFSFQIKFLFSKV